MIVFLGLEATPSIKALLIMQSVLLVPVISLVCYHAKCIRKQDKITKTKIAQYMFVCVMAILAMILSAITLALEAKLSATAKGCVGAGIILLNFSWIPWLQKKTMEVRKPNPKPEENSASSSRDSIDDETDGSSNQGIEKNSHWKTLFISSLVKVILTIPISMFFFYVAFADTLEGYTDGWNSNNWDISNRQTQRFIINILTTILGYTIGVFACRTGIDLGSYFVPLCPVTPMLATAILMIKGSCTLLIGLEGKGEECQVEGDTMNGLAAGAVLCWILSQIFSMGIFSIKGSSIILEHESMVRWHKHIIWNLLSLPLSWIWENFPSNFPFFHKMSCAT